MDYPSFLATAYLLVGVLTILLGLVILRENAAARLNRLTALMLFFAGIGALLGSGFLWVARTGGGASAARVANFAYLWEFFFPTLLLFAASFPREIRLFRRHGLGEAAIYLPHTIHFILMFAATIFGTSFGLDLLADRIPLLAGLIGLIRVLLREFFTWHRHLFSLVNLTYIGAAMLLIARNQRSVVNASVRDQLRVILVGMGAGVILYSIGVPLNVLLGLKLNWVVSSTLLMGSLWICSGTIAYAIVRHRFLDARWIVRRTILYALASAIIVGIYLQVVRQLHSRLADPLGIPAGVLDWMALVIPLVLFQPIMSRLEEALEGLILRGRRELRSVVDRLSQQMAATIDFDGVATSMVRDVPESLAAGGAAVLLQSAETPGRYCAVASWGLGPEVLDWFEKSAPLLTPPPTTGRPHTERDWVEAASLAGMDPGECDRMLRARGPHLTYELQHMGVRLGLFVLGPKLSRMRYSGEEIGIVSSLASQAGVALKNSILHHENLQKAVLEEELALARKIQQTFLPSYFPDDLPCDVHGLNIPSKQVGGDYFDFFPAAGGAYILAVADVAGKGVPAALLASMVHAALRTLLKESFDIGRVMECVNRLICESTSPEQFVTLFLGQVDLDDGSLIYANAGHNYPLHLRSDGSTRFLDSSDLVLGIDPTQRYAVERLALGAGDALLLYTDGVTEARDPSGEEFGEDRLSRLVRSGGGLTAREIVGAIRDDLLRFSESSDMQDDMTLLCLRVPRS